MSSCSESSVVLSDRGFPSKCVCGLGVTIFTAKTQDNPGRPFFRCESKKDAKSWTNKKDVSRLFWFLMFMCVIVALFNLVYLL